MTAKKKKSLLLPVIGVIIILIGIYAGYRTFGPGTGDLHQGPYLYVHTGSDYEKLKEALEQGGFISDGTSFNALAHLAQLPKHVRAGRYRITRGMSNYNIIRMLRSGRQAPVKLVINKLRTRQDLVNLFGANLEVDSVGFKKMLSDPDYAEKFGVDTNNMLSIVLPDTYEMFWNTPADKALNKIAKNHQHFWTDERKQQAKNHGLTPVTATILASIVDEETNAIEDKPNIASVYLNRLKKGMRLQADPTVRFALGDFTIHRVAGAMLQNPSLYNTYVHEGLPPGLICTPGISSIDAVLQAPQTNYLYFCAKADFSGRTVFAVTFDEQLKNAREYQKALDARGIHK